MARCRMGRDCLARAMPEGENLICEDCARIAAEEIEDLPADYYELSQRLTRIGAAPDGMPPPPNKAESSPPINLLADSLRSQIIWRTALWEIPLREHLGLPEAEDTFCRPGYLTSRAALLIAANIHDLAGLPPTLGYVNGPDCEPEWQDGIGGLRSLLGLHRMIRTYLGVTVQTIRLPGMCPSSLCGAADLRRTYGEDEVYCGICARRYSWNEYRHYVSLAAAGHDFSAPAATFPTANR